MFSVYGHLVLLLWACGKAEHHGKSAWQRRSAQLMAAGEREREIQYFSKSLSGIGNLATHLWDG
jgi:hypothetical protein